MTANSTVSQSIAVADPEIPENVIKPNADGSVNIAGSISVTATTAAHATAAAPSYVEGSDDDLSVNLTGDMRVIAKQNGTWTVGISAAQTIAVTNAGTFAVTQATAASLNATVVGTGTFAVQAAQSGTWNIGTVTTVTGVTPAFGATGASVPASAAYMGARTLAATPSDTTAQLNAPVLDTKGSLATQPYGLGDNCISGLTSAMTGTTSTAVTGIGQPGSGLYNYITQITIGNSHATVGTFVEFQDGNGGSTFYTAPAAAVYGGATLTFPKPLKQPTSNTALYCKDTTTGANVIVSVSGFKGP